MGEISLTGVLVARGPAAAFILDEDQVATVGEGAKRFPVVAIVNGYSWRTSVYAHGRRVHGRPQQGGAHGRGRRGR
jgi:hypothetical protein